MPQLKSGYFSGSIHAVGPNLCYFSDKPTAIGFISLARWIIRNGEFSVVEVIMGDWVSGTRTKQEIVFLSGLSSRQASSVLSRLCLNSPDRHFVKRRVFNGNA